MFQKVLHGCKETRRLLQNNVLSESLRRLLRMNRNVCQIGPSCPAPFSAKTTILSSLDEQEQHVYFYFKEYLFIL